MQQRTANYCLLNHGTTIQTKSQAIDDPALGTTLCELGKCYALQGKYSDAEPLFKKALGIAEKEESQNHHSELLQQVLRNYGNLLYNMHRKEEGDKYFARLQGLMHK